MLTHFSWYFLSQLQGPQGCATMRVSSSVSQMGAVSRPPGSVMVIQTVRMAVTNTTPAHLAPAPPHSSAVTMEIVYYAAGFVMGTTTAGTWAMKETVPHRLSDVQAGSGNALATVCASTSPQCVTTLLTAPMVLTSLLSAVSLIPAFLVSLEHIFFVYHKDLIILLNFQVCWPPQIQLNSHIIWRTGSNSDLIWFDLTFFDCLYSENRSDTSRHKSFVLNVICLSLYSCVKIMHVCDSICINLKIICDFPFLPSSLLSDEPLPGRNKISIIGRNAASSLIHFQQTQYLY